MLEEIIPLLALEHTARERALAKGLNFNTRGVKHVVCRQKAGGGNLKKLHERGVQ